mmetsp:Transcript_24297/g.75245  ORF Transcript_24297/g.75245 Transcript_24297/m.75245 type:complete len:388 (+) Transcript_24297:2020-3183(+)
MLAHLGGGLRRGALGEVVVQGAEDVDVAHEDVADVLLRHELAEHVGAQVAHLAEARRVVLQRVHEAREVVGRGRGGEVEREHDDGRRVDGLVRGELVVEEHVHDGLQQPAVGHVAHEPGNALELVVLRALEVERVDLHAVGEGLEELLHDGHPRAEARHEHRERVEVRRTVGREGDLQGEHLVFDGRHGVRDRGEAGLEAFEQGLVAGERRWRAGLDEARGPEALRGPVLLRDAEGRLVEGGALDRVEHDAIVVRRGERRLRRVRPHRDGVGRVVEVLGQVALHELLRALDRAVVAPAKEEGVVRALHAEAEPARAVGLARGDERAEEAVDVLRDAVLVVQQEVRLLESEVEEGLHRLQHGIGLEVGHLHHLHSDAVDQTFGLLGHA